MALTDTAVRNAKPKNKPYKITDAQGLYLLVNPGGNSRRRTYQHPSASTGILRSERHYGRR